MTTATERRAREVTPKLVSISDTYYNGLFVALDADGHVWHGETQSNWRRAPAITWRRVRSEFAEEAK